MELHEKCGVVGIYLSSSCDENECARKTYYALTSLQHRGQESAGIAAANEGEITLHKNLGLVGEVFKKKDIENLRGSIAVGHVRYATSGSRTIENAQPFVNKCALGQIALCHNGQLVNYEPLQEMLVDSGCTFSSNSDSEVVLKLIARNSKKGFVNAVMNALELLKGSYSLCIMSEDTLVGARDPNGIRPLCLGTFGNGSYILASESCAFDSVNADFVRDISPGEIVVIGANGIESIKPETNTFKRTCVFEYVYFSRPDSVIDGISVEESRLRMGKKLAEESSVQADVVCGVPDSGISAALGFSMQSGIPYVSGIIKNKYIGRTFIAPTQEERENMVYVKLNAIRSNVSGKRVVVIDDSIVRGTTSRRLVQMLRRAGASEVHMRISSPPVKFPCHFGIDTPSKAELISSSHVVEEIRSEIGADSLAFISLEGMMSALGGCKDIVGLENKGFCTGCFNGEYPVAIH